MRSVEQRDDSQLRGNPSLSPGEATAQSFVQLPMKRDDSVCGLPCRQFAPNGYAQTLFSCLLISRVTAPSRVTFAKSSNVTPI